MNAEQAKVFQKTAAQNLNNGIVAQYSSLFLAVFSELHAVDCSSRNLQKSVLMLGAKLARMIRLKRRT